MTFPFHIQQTPVPRAVLFDYDGVLVASEPIHFSAWMQLLEELGLPADAETLKKEVGKTAPETLKKLLMLHRPEMKPTPSQFKLWAQRKNDLYLSSAQNQLEAYPGAREGLQWLRDRQVKIAIVSNGRRNQLIATLEKLNLINFFDEIFSRDDVPAFKPDPTPYLMAAEALNVKPQECLAVEDSPPGLQAALLANIPAAAILTGFPREELEHPVVERPELAPIWIASSLQDFFNWLRKKETLDLLL